MFDICINCLTSARGFDRSGHFKSYRESTNVCRCLQRGVRLLWCAQVPRGNITYLYIVICGTERAHTSAGACRRAFCPQVPRGNITYLYIVICGTCMVCMCICIMLAQHGNIHVYMQAHLAQHGSKFFRGLCIYTYMSTNSAQHGNKCFGGLCSCTLGWSGTWLWMWIKLNLLKVERMLVIISA